MKVAIIAAFLISSLSAQTTKVDNLKVGSREYKNAEVTKIDSIFARVVHSDGSARIALADLPADVQAALKYDADADTSSRENAKKAADAAAERAKIRAESREFIVPPINVLPDGLLATVVGKRLMKGEPNRKEIIFVQAPTKGKDYISNHDYRFIVHKIGSYTYTTALGSSSTVEKY